MPSLPDLERNIHSAKDRLDSFLSKAPEVDWLATEQAALEVLKYQDALIQDFENYRAAHQECIHLDQEAARLDQQARALEQVVILPNNPALADIEYKHQAIEQAHNWFDRLDALRTFLAAMEAYIHDLSTKQEELRRMENRCHEQINQARELLQHGNVLDQEDINQIEQLNLPNTQGMAHYEAFQMLDNTLMHIAQVYETAYHKVSMAQQNQAGGEY